MCRNIKTLFNFKPVASDVEIRAASLQFVRKISGSVKPSKLNEAAFEGAVDEIAVVVERLLDSLVTSVPAKDRDMEAAKGLRKNNFTDLAPVFGVDLADPIEGNRRRSSVYVEDFAIEGRPKMP